VLALAAKRAIERVLAVTTGGVIRHDISVP
jgi:hypothetical protein